METTSVINKMAVFPEEKRDYVMSILNTEESVLHPSSHMTAGEQKIKSPQPKTQTKVQHRRVVNKFFDPKKLFSKTFQKN